MMEMRESKLFLGNLSVSEQLSGKEKAGKLESSKNIQSSSVFKDVRVLLPKEPTNEIKPAFTRCWNISKTVKNMMVAKFTPKHTIH